MCAPSRREIFSEMQLLDETATKDPRKSLSERVWRGDPAAIDLALAALPNPLPARTRRALRDEAILAADAWLASALGPASLRARSKILADAGRRLARGERLPDRGALARLNADERMLLARIIGSASTLAAWPSWRRIADILAPPCSAGPVEAAQQKTQNAD